MNKDISVMNKPSMTFKIGKNELVQFTLLAQKGLDIHTMVQLSFKESEKIIDALNKGQNLMDILAKHSSNMEILTVLSRRLNLKQSMECIENMDQSKKLFEKEVLKKGIYPAMIFCFSYAILLFFSHWILPQMTQFLMDSSFHVGLWILKALYTVLFFVCILFLILLVSYFNQKEWKIFAKFYELPMFVKIKTYQFAFLFEQFMRQGISSEECLHLIAEIKSVQSEASKILKDLEAGISMEASIKTLKLDPSFIFFFQAGMKTQDLAGMLHIYCENCIFQIQKSLSRISECMQCISYSCVGILVIVVYQVLLLPLNMLYEL